LRRQPLTSGDTKSDCAACQLSRMRNALKYRSARTGPFIGDMVQYAGVLHALDLGDR
jgi:hypothetical protein